MNLLFTIAEMIERARTAKEAADAEKFAQAALHAANACLVMKQIQDMEE